MSVTKYLGPLVVLLYFSVSGALHAQIPSQVSRDPMGFLHSLETASDPNTVALRHKIEAGPADLARAQAEIAKDGVSLDPASLQRPLPPLDQNAAPLYVKLAQLLHDKPLGLPSYADPLGAPQTYTPDQLAAVQKIYDSHPDVWTLLHQAADRPQCVFARHWSQGFSVLFPEFAQLREAARLLNTETYLLAAQGKYDEAVKNQTRGFRVAEDAASDPVLISYLVGVACEAITLRGMQNVLDQAGPNAAVAESVRQAVEEHRSHLSLRYALAGEAMMQSVDLGLMRAALAHNGLRGLAATFAPKDDPSLSRLSSGTPADRRFAQDWLDASEAIILTRMHGVIAAADLTPVPRRQAFTQEAGQAEAPPTLLTILPSLILPTFAPVAEKETQRVAVEEVTIAGAAILTERAKTGAWPETLPEPFPDPFTSKPLLYRREGTNGFVVYSAGQDGRFDGGKPGAGQALFRYLIPRNPVPISLSH